MHALTLLFFVTYLIILRPVDGASLRLAEELAEASSRVAPVRARALKNLGTPCAARICLSRGSKNASARSSAAGA